MKQNRDAAIAFTEGEEGPYPRGWNPNDPSYCGIMLPAFEQLCAKHGRPKPTLDDLKNIDPGTIDLFYNDLCDAIGFDTIPSGFDFLALDISTNEGPHAWPAHWLLAQAVLRDGGPEAAIQAICDARLAYKKRRTKWAKNGKGWAGRIGERVPSRAIAMMEKTA